MPINLTKNYPDLLEILHLRENERTTTLRKIFDRDIENNTNLNFRSKIIRPIKKDGQIDMDTLFNHLITEEIEIEESSGYKYKKREFEPHRSMRLHWIKYHIEENKSDRFEVFSIDERDQRRRINVIKTYLWDIERKYIIVLEPQKSNLDYYLLSAYYLNRDYGVKQMKKRFKKKLNHVV